MSYRCIDNNLFLCSLCDHEMRESQLDGHDRWHKLKDAENALDSLRSRLAAAEKVVEAARILLDEMEDPNNLLDPNRRRTLRRVITAYDEASK